MTERRWQRGPDGQIIRAEREAPPSPPGERAEGPEPQRRRARLGLALRLGIRDTYDYLGTVVLTSILWAVLAGAALVGGHALGLLLFGALPGVLPMFLAVLCGVAGLVLVGGPLAAGAFRYARNAAAREEPEVFDLGWGFRAAFRRSVTLAAVQAGGTLLFAANGYFYLSQKQPLLVVLGALFGYAFLFWSAMALYQWPLLVEQELGTARVLRKSALLVLDNFPFTVGLALILLLLTALLWIFMVGGVLLWAGMTAMLLTQATRELLRKYGALPPDPTLDPIAGEVGE